LNNSTPIEDNLPPGYEYTMCNMKVNYKNLIFKSVLSKEMVTAPWKIRIGLH